jgi:hypothetical protein
MQTASAAETQLAGRLIDTVAPKLRVGRRAEQLISFHSTEFFISVLADSLAWWQFTKTAHVLGNNNNNTSRQKQSQEKERKIAVNLVKM